MIQKMLVVFVLICLTIPSVAQDKITLQEEHLSSFYPQRIFKGNAKGYIFKVGEEDFQPVGIRGKNIETILMQDEAAYKEFKKFKRKINSGFVSYGIAASAYIAAPLIAKPTYSLENQQKIGISSMTTLLIGTITGFVLHKRAIHNLKRAVEIYNSNLD